MKSTRGLQSEELTMDQFSESLNQWAKSELSSGNSLPNIIEAKEKILEAKEKILEAYQGYLDHKANPNNNGFSSPRSLKLSNLGLNSLPDVIFQIKDLSSLDIGNNWSLNRAQNNKISKISPLIANLKKLRTFTFHYNQISKLPDAIGELKELKELRGQHNKLDSLPKSIGNLKKLESVFLPNNKISSIPEEIKNCPIQFLTLNGNNLTDLAILRISYIKTLTALGIQANRDLSINPEFYNNLRGKMEALDAMIARNEYHLTNLINKIISKQDDPSVIWTLNQFSFSKEKKLNPQNLSQPESKLVENTSHFFNLLIKFYQSDYFQGLNRDQQDSISQALSKILVIIHARRDDLDYLQRLDNIAKRFNNGSGKSMIYSIYEIMNCGNIKSSLELLELNKKQTFDYLKQQFRYFHILDLAETKLQELKQQNHGFSNDISLFGNIMEKYNNLFQIELPHLTKKDDIAGIELPHDENFIRSIFSERNGDIKLLSNLMALQISRDLYSNPSSRLGEFNNLDFIKNLKSQIDLIALEAIELLKSIGLNPAQFAIAQKEISKMQIEQFGYLLNEELQKYYQNTADLLVDNSEDPLTIINKEQEKLIIFNFKKSLNLSFSEINKISPDETKLDSSKFVKAISDFQINAENVFKPQRDLLESKRLTNIKTAQIMIKAIEIGSTLTSEVIDRGLSKFENNEIAREILNDLVGEAVEASEERFVSSQLNLVEKRIPEIESKIAELQIAELQKKWSKIRIELSSKNDSDSGEDNKAGVGIKICTVSSGEETGGGEVAIKETAVSDNYGSSNDSSRRLSKDGSQKGDSPSKSPSVADLRKKIEHQNDENSLRRVCCCPTSFIGPSVRSLIKKFSKKANRGRGD